mgnify:CR=1 FL=1
MGLKSDIYAAFEKNLGKDFVDATSEGQKKVDDLAGDLSKAVIKFITEQKFTITKMEASTQLVKTTPSLTTPTGIPQPPGAPTVPSNIPALVIPNITVKVDERGSATDNKLSGVESMNSEVMLKFIKPDSK